MKLCSEPMERVYVYLGNDCDLTYKGVPALNLCPIPKENICFDFDVFIECLCGWMPNARDRRAPALLELLTTFCGVLDLITSFLG